MKCRVKYYYEKKKDPNNVYQNAKCQEIGTIKPESHFYKNCGFSNSNNQDKETNYICKNCQNYYTINVPQHYILKSVGGVQKIVKK